MFGRSVAACFPSQPRKVHRQTRKARKHRRSSMDMHAMMGIPMAASSK